MEVLLERIKQLCKTRSITVSILESKLGFPTNTIYQWKKRVPGTEKLQKVADFFDVSLDYLLGRVDTPHVDNSINEKKLTVEEALKTVMSSDGKPLTNTDREIISAMIEAYLENKDN